MADELAARSAARSCDSCDLCCRTYEIKELAKPMGVTCQHLSEMRCTIHGAHPRTCRTFRCFWLNQPDLGEEWRPSVAGFVRRLDMDGTTLWVDTDPARPGAWRLAPYFAQIKAWSQAIKDGLGVVLVHDGPGVYVVFPETELFLSEPPRGARFQAGYREEDERIVPWAEIMTRAVQVNRMGAAA